MLIKSQGHAERLVQFVPQLGDAWLRHRHWHRALTAQGGFASTDIGDLFKWSARLGRRRLVVTADLRRRRRESRVQSAAAQWDALAASYRGQVLVAFREVEDQLSAGLVAPVGSSHGANRYGRIGEPRNGALDLALSQRRRESTRVARPAPQRAREPAAGTAGSLRAIPGDGRVIRALGGGWGTAAPTAQAAHRPLFIRRADNRLRPAAFGRGTRRTGMSRSDVSPRGALASERPFDVLGTAQRIRRAQPPQARVTALRDDLRSGRGTRTRRNNNHGDNACCISFAFSR